MTARPTALWILRGTLAATFALFALQEVTQSAIPVTPGAPAVQSEAFSASEQPAERAAAITPAVLPDIGPTVDREMRAMLRDRRVRGAAAVVAYRGRIVYAKGYGSADPAGRIAYSPDTVANLFSVSKPVSTLAILSRAQALGIDLDADVNEYLTTIELEPHAGPPVTLRRLLSHSAGLSDDFRNEVALTPDTIVSLADHMQKQPPRRRLPAGSLIGYTNNALGLAALAVADASQSSYESILEENLVRPAGLRSLSIAWPTAAIEKGTFSFLHDGPLAEGREEPAFATNPAPAGGVFATPRDAGAILLLLMERGQLDGRQVVPREVIDAMLTRQASAAPEMSAQGLGIRLHRMGGQRFAEHAGENRNAIMFLPDQRFGMYIVTTRHSDAEALYPTFRKIASRWFELPFDPPPAPRTASPASRSYAGQYQDGRLVEGAARRIGSLFAPSELSDLSFDEEGYLVLDGDRFSEVRPGLFRAFAARQTRNGELQWLKLGALPDGRRIVTQDLSGMLQLRWYEDPWGQRNVLTILCIALVVSAIAFAIRRSAPLLDRSLGILATAGAVAFPATAAIFYSNADRLFVELTPEPLVLAVAPWLPVAALVPAAWLAWRTTARRGALPMVLVGLLALVLGTEAWIAFV
jgi:CubicO group peptidase (beta-lactamase class C family)